MKTPPVFLTVANDSEVVSIFGHSPVRVFPFDRAPQHGTPFFRVPYAVWQIVTGSPENYLGEAPDIDRATIQIDVYGAAADDVRAGVTALRDAIEPFAHVVRWGSEGTDAETSLQRASFDVDWFVQR